MAVEYNRNINTAVIPKLPTVNMPQSNYNTQNNNDPSAYYTKALGFLPIDTRYLSNPTNSLAYNTIADVLFNAKAWEERWGNTEYSWLSTPLGRIPGIVVDSLTLLKHQTIDPIVQGTIDDGVNGFLRGSSTAAFNILINLGNTLDVVANPIKGLVLDGGEGFVKGLFGDHEGRKQYDYSDYIDTGSGFVDFVASMAAEILSDPLNWISWGSKAVIGSGAKALGNAAADTVIKSVDDIITAGKSSVDDVAEALAKNVSFIDDTSAKAIAQSMATKLDDGTKIITKASAKNSLTNLSDQFTRSLKRLGRQGANADSLQKAAKRMSSSLLDSKSTRAKLDAFFGRAYTPTNQRIISSYLDNLDISKLPTQYLAGAKAYNIVENVERGLRYAAGATGLDVFIGADALRKQVGKHLNNYKARKEMPRIIKGVQDLDEKLRFKFDTELEEEVVALNAVHKDVFDKLTEIQDEYTQAGLSKLTVYKTVEGKETPVYKELTKDVIISAQKKALAQIDELVSKTFTEQGLKTFDDYIDYFSTLVSRSDSNIMRDNLTNLKRLRNILTENVSDDTVFKRFVSQLQYYRAYQDIALGTKGQQDSIELHANRMKEWRKFQEEAAELTDRINKNEIEFDKVITNLMSNTKGSVDSVVDQLQNTIVPGVLRALSNQKNDADLLIELNDSFQSALKNYETKLSEATLGTNAVDVADTVVDESLNSAKRALVKAYQELNTHLKSLTAFPEFNINTANTVVNKIGAKPLTTSLDKSAYRYSASVETPIKGFTTKSQINSTSEQERILKKAEKFEKTLKNDPDYQVFQDYNRKLFKDEHPDGDVVFNSFESTKQFIRTKWDIDTAQKHIELLERANKIKKTNLNRYVDVPSTKTFTTAEDLTKMVKDLPLSNVQDAAQFVDVDKYIRYHLVTYTMMSRKTSVLNTLIGLDELGNTLQPTQYPIYKTILEFNDDAVAQSQYADLFEVIRTNYSSKYSAENLEPVDVVELTNHFRDDVISFVKEVDVFFKDVMSDRFLITHLFNNTDEVIDAATLDKIMSRLKEYVDKAKTIDLSTYIEDSYKLLYDTSVSGFDVLLQSDSAQLINGFKRMYKLYNDALKVTELTDPELVTFFNTTTSTKLISKNSTPLANLIDLYSDTDSDFYKALNPEDPTIYSEDVYNGTIKETRELIERLTGYKTLISKVITFIDNTGYGDFYKAAALDSLRSMLERNQVLASFNIDESVNDILTKMDLFIRNRVDLKSTAMDSMLSLTATDVFENSTDTAAVQIADDVIKSLANAHDATVDVDNWVRLMFLSKHTSDTRVNGVFEELLRTAKGRYIVVFDIETVSAEKNLSTPYQIAGKVLDSKGNVVQGSEFNYIIKPPVGAKPLPFVLEKQTPSGMDPDYWWDTFIVNAQNTETRPVFNTVEDALTAFRKHCTAVAGQKFILAGQNIREFDINVLKKLGGIDNKGFFENVDVFDSLDYFNTNSWFQLQGDRRALFKERFKNILLDAVNSENPVLTHKPFTFDDVRTLSAFKEVYAKVNFGDSKLKATDSDRIFGESDTISGSIKSDAFKIEDIIDEVTTVWRSTSTDFKGKKYITVSKINPDSLDETIQSYLEELKRNGLIDVVPGTNIMQYFNTNVANGRILINPKTVVNYEMFNFFDADKVKEHYDIDGKGVLFNDMRHMSNIARGIMNNREWLTQDLIDYLIVDSRRLLKSFEFAKSTDTRFAKAFRNNLDDASTVAAAIYFYQRLSDDSLIKQSDDFKLFGDIKEAKKDIRAIKNDDDFVSTPLQHFSNKDPKTDQPRFIYEDSDYNYEATAKAASCGILESVNKHYSDRNLHSAVQAAAEKVRSDLSVFGKKVDDYLKEHPKTRVEIEARIKGYGKVLDDAAINEILTRADRVDALRKEAFLRAGRTIFETKNEIDLSDVAEAEGFIVMSNIPIKRGEFTTYAQVILMTKDIVKNAEDITLPARVIKRSVTGIPEREFNLIYEGRQLFSGFVDNLGLSRGDIVDEELINCFDDMLQRLGFSKETIMSLATIEDLKTIGWFKKPRVNHSIIGGKDTWAYVMNDPDYRYITDPFKKLYYTTQSAIKSQHLSTMSFLNMVYNEHNTLEAIFKNLPNEDVCKLLKKHPDFGLYYVVKSGYWDKTKSGVVLKELKVVNAKSIELGKEMEVHILPRTQASQAIKAVNDYELPFVVQIFKDLSDVYKVCYLGSIGFLIRNFIDSNYKTYAALEGEVSLPKQMKHFFSTLGLVRKHTTIGQEYTAAMGQYFRADLEYEVFYKYCNNYADLGIAEKIAAEYDKKYYHRIVRQVNRLSEKFKADAVARVKDKLIDPNLFTVMDVFIKSGPSGGMAKSVLNNIVSASEDLDEKRILQQFNTLMTEHTPLRFVFGMNDTIEQAARLSMFLQDLERGSTIDTATKNIIRTHFDYSDKTLGMLYTEIVFPFMSFSYKNLEFWVETMYKNPILVGQLENILRPILDYQSIFQPDREAYESFDYTFDWSKDVMSFEARAPWTMINAARLYHILAGNIVIDSGKDVEHDAGYGSKTNDLYRVFKLSPSVLDAVKMLYNPLDAYSQRMLPSYEPLKTMLLNMLDGKAVTDDMNITTLTNMLPYINVITQRSGINVNGRAHNNILKRIEDAGPLMAMSSVFGAAYVPQKDNYYWYDSDYNVLGGLKTNYYIKRNYSNPYSSKNPRYTLTRMAQNKRPKRTNLYSAKKSAYDQQYNSMYRSVADRILGYRIKDYKRYY